MGGRICIFAMHKNAIARNPSKRHQNAAKTTGIANREAPNDVAPRLKGRVASIHIKAGWGPLKFPHENKATPAFIGAAN